MFNVRHLRSALIVQQLGLLDLLHFADTRQNAVINLILFFGDLVDVQIELRPRHPRHFGILERWVQRSHRGLRLIHGFAGRQHPVHDAAHLIVDRLAALL